jgi:hypothetical protein
VGFIGVVSFVPRQTDNHNRLDGGLERRSDQKKGESRRRNTRRMSSDWRPDSHGTGEGDAMRWERATARAGDECD